MVSGNKRCFDTKHNKLKGFIIGFFFGTVVAIWAILRLFILPFREPDIYPLVLYIGIPIVLLSALFAGIRYLRRTVNTRIELTENDMKITIGESTQSFRIEDFAGFIPVHKHEYLDTEKFMVFKNGDDNDSNKFLLPGMTDEHYSYVLLRDVSNRQYQKMMNWLSSILKDQTVEKAENAKSECQPLSYDKLVEEYRKK